MESTFEIPRLDDNEIWTRVHSALSEWKFSRCGAKPLIGHSSDVETGGSKATDSEWFYDLLELKTIAVENFTFFLPNQCEVRVYRERENNKLTGVYDRVLISQPDSIRDYVTPAKIAAALRTSLGAVDERKYFDFLTEADKHVAESRSQIIADLTTIQSGFFAKISEFITEQTARFEDKKRELELTAKEKENQLASAYEVKEQELARQTRSLEEREKSLDLRSNTDARRDLRIELKREINSRTTTPQVTKGTQLRRTWVLLAYIALLAYFAWGTFFFSGSVQIGGVPMDVLPADDPFLSKQLTLEEWQKEPAAGIHWPNIVRQVAFGLAFAVTAGFFLRWLNRWAQSHSDEEFRIKRLELDIDRASWLVEMMYEWKDEKGSTMPSELVRMLGANLFVDPVHSDHAMTAADALGSALVESASQAKLKVGDNELLLKRGGIKKLSQKTIEGTGEE